MFVFQSDKLVTKGNTNMNFQSDTDSHQSTSRFVFNFGGATISQRSVKQSCNSDFIREAKYIAAFEVAKEVVCLKKFLMELVGRTTHDTILCEQWSCSIVQRNKKPS